MGKKIVELTEDTFGQLKDDKGRLNTIKRFTWKNSNNVSVSVITYGAYTTSVKIPDKNGKIEDIVYGFDNIEEYLQPLNRYFGATVGRIANVTAKGKMTVEGVEYELPKNSGEHHLHGGVKGFDKVFWEPYVNGTKLILSYHAADMEEGYPGDLVINLTFELNENNEFKIDYKANTTKPTAINMTNHSYFNLAGSGKGATELYKHIVMINAEKITETEGVVPTGKFLNVADTVFDFRVPTTLGDVIHKTVNGNGYSANYCINQDVKKENSFAARVKHLNSGRIMEVYSNQPGLQFYTGNNQPEDKNLKGRDGFIRKHGAMCLETQKYPDSVNHPNFPSITVYPGEQYHHTAIYKFIVEK